MYIFVDVVKCKKKEKFTFLMNDRMFLIFFLYNTFYN